MLSENDRVTSDFRSLDAYVASMLHQTEALIGAYMGKCSNMEIYIIRLVYILYDIITRYALHGDTILNQTCLHQPSISR